MSTILPDQPLLPQPFLPAQRVQGFGATVFAEFTALANQHQAVNLGQGFPDFPAPDFIKAAAAQAIAGDLNQYTRSAGHPRLVKALAAFYSPRFDRTLDPMTELVITVGATEGIFATVQALVDPGDEVILIEPFYDSYPAAVQMAGGVPVYVPLRPPTGDQAHSAAHWRLDMAELATAFTPRTRLIVINTPHNPVGKVFSRDELSAIAELVLAHNHSATGRQIFVLSDEVYEWMTYDGAAHVRMATLPGMWAYTITLGSAGKTFSVTGWKIGWVIAPAPVVYAVVMAHQWIPFCVATPLQEAVAIAVEGAEAAGYYDWLATMYEEKRDRLLASLTAAGLTPTRSQGSYFILADTSGLAVAVPPGEARDVAVCRWLTVHAGVAAIPPSAFFSPAHRQLVADLARFTFCKSDPVLAEADRRLRANLGKS